MHEWEKRLELWRRDMDRLLDDPDAVAELESHLRDEMDRQVRQGRTSEEAITLAIEQLGPPENIRGEFAKVSKPWWPAYGVLAASVLAECAVLFLLGWAASRGAWDGLLIAHVAAITLGYLLTYAVGALALCYALRRPIRELTIGQRIFWRRALTGMTVCAFALTLVGVLLGSAWAHRQWGRGWSWDAKEMGGLLSLAWQVSLLVLAYCAARLTRLLMCVGILGVAVVTYAWIATSIVGDGLQNYGSNHNVILTLFVAVLVATFLIAAVGLAPSGWLRFRRTA